MTQINKSKILSQKGTGNIIHLHSYNYGSLRKLDGRWYRVVRFFGRVFWWMKLGVLLVLLGSFGLVSYGILTKSCPLSYFYGVG